MAGDGSTALIGAGDDEEPNGGKAGSVYVFSRSDGTWSHQTKLAATDGDPQDQFGSKVAVANDGETALVGAQTDEDPHGEKTGSAYVFEGTDGAHASLAKTHTSVA